MSLLARGSFDSKDFNGLLKKIAVYLGAVSSDTLEWQAHVRDDLDGQALAPKSAANALIAGSATTGSTTPIAADSARAGFRFQNISDDTTIWWAFESSVTALAAFKLLPGATVVENIGDSHCRAAISVVTETGTANFAFQSW